MADWRDSDQLELLTVVLQALAEAVVATFEDSFGPVPEDAEPIEHHLEGAWRISREVGHLLDHAETDSVAVPFHLLEDVRQLAESIWLLGHEARERRAVRVAVAATVGEEELRYTLLNRLGFDGVSNSHFMWDSGFDGLELAEHERKALAAFRTKPASIKTYRKQRTAIGRAMGWLKGDGTRGSTIPIFELAHQFDRLTHGRRRLDIASSVTGLSRSIDAPLDGRSAVRVLATLHGINSGDACLRHLHAAKARFEKLRSRFVHLGDLYIFEARLDKLVPDLSELPASFNE